MALLHVSQCTDRKPENLATMHLKYHCVGTGVQKCQTGEMTLKNMPMSTISMSPPEVFCPLTLWSNTGKLWHRELWKKIPPNVMVMVVFPAHSVAKKLRVLEPRKFPKETASVGVRVRVGTLSAYSSAGTHSQDSDPCLCRFKWGLAVPGGLLLSEEKVHVAKCPSAQVLCTRHNKQQPSFPLLPS